MIKFHRPVSVCPGKFSRKSLRTVGSLSNRLKFLTGLTFPRAQHLSGEQETRSHGAYAEEIALQVSRSLRVVQEVLDDSGEDHVRVAECSQEIEQEGASKIDYLLELLSKIPEGAMEHLLGLVKLRRQEKQLRQRPSGSTTAARRGHVGRVRKEPL